MHQSEAILAPGLWPSVSTAPPKAATCTPAERRMRRGKKLVIAGFVVAVIGIIGYCMVCLGAGVNQELGTALLENVTWLAGPTLAVVGLGTLLWLLGSFMYLNGALESDVDAPAQE